MTPADLTPATPADLPTARAAAGVPPQAREPIRRDAVFRRLLALADLAAATGGLASAGVLAGQRVHLIALASLPLIVVVAKMMGRYDRDEVVMRKSTLEEFPALLALAGAFTLAWTVIAALAGLPLRPADLGAATLWASTSLLLTVGRALARAAAGTWAPRERVLIAGSSTSRARLARLLATDPGARLEVVGFLPIHDERRASDRDYPDCRRRQDRRLRDLAGVCAELEVDRLVMLASDVDNEVVLDAVRSCAELGVKLSLVPGLLEIVGSSVEFDCVGGVTVLGLRRHGLTRSSRTIKRAMDLAGASAALALSAPLALLAAAAIKLDSPGPVLFRQPRVGRKGRVFAMLKFRSMVDGADAKRAELAALNETDGIFKIDSDPRVTRVGRWLRRTSLDELPQLLNVLRGDMSLVGPRPLVIDEDRLIEGHHRFRLTLAPGMTGPWQVLGPTRPPLSEMVKSDYLYAVNWSLWTDVKILLRTLVHVSARRGR